MDNRYIKIPDFKLENLTTEDDHSFQEDKPIIPKISNTPTQNREHNSKVKNDGKTGTFIMSCFLFAIMFSPLLLLKGSITLLYLVFVIIAAAMFTKSEY